MWVSNYETVFLARIDSSSFLDDITNKQSWASTLTAISMKIMSVWVEDKNINDQEIKGMLVKLLFRVPLI